MEFITKIWFRSECKSCGKAVKNDWTPDKPYEYGKPLPHDEKDGKAVCSFCGGEVLEIITAIHFKNVCDKCGAVAGYKFENIQSLPDKPYLYGSPLPTPVVEYDEDGVKVNRKYCPNCKHVGDVVPQ